MIHWGSPCNKLFWPYNNFYFYKNMEHSLILDKNIPYQNMIKARLLMGENVNVFAMYLYHVIKCTTHIHSTTNSFK